MPNWTQKQSDAIFDRGHSLVISAGAGSGKTSVLAERILQKLINGSDIGDFLVVTFTNAAAADLRAKLYTNLNKALAKNPGNSHLYRQLFAIEGAFISTIHSFCFDLIKHNFQALGLSPKLRIADQAEADILLADCVNTLFDKKYEKEDKGFLMLIKQLVEQKKEANFIENIIGIYNKVRSFPYPDEWFEYCINFIKEERDKAKEDFFKTECGKIFIKDILSRIEKCREILLKAEKYKPLLSEKQWAVFLEIAYTCDSIEAAVDKGYETLQKLIGAVKIPSFKKNKPPMDEDFEAADLKSQATKIINEIGKLCTEDKKNIFADFAVALQVMIKLRRLILDLDAEFSAAKRERGILDYSDLEHMSLKLLSDKNGDRSELCKKMSETFEEIYIDEYQDTNPIQDMIFSLIAREDNKFIVGDVKQSLYRFRNAEPEIFTSYIENEVPGRKTLYLSKNFRCEKPIIEFTNRVFKYAYDGTYGRYGENEKLVYGKDSDFDAPPVTVAITEEYSDAEQEANYIADEILRLKREMKKSDGTELRYSDFAILLRSPKNGAEVILKALRKKRIPVYSEQGSSFLDAPEILLMMSLLQAVDNPRNDIALTALLRSPVFNFTDSELAEIRELSPGATMYDSVHDCARKHRARPQNARFTCVPRITPYLHKKLSKRFRPLPHVSAEVAEKADKFLKAMAVWQRKSEGEPSHKFIWYIYASTGLYSLASGEVQGDVIQKNLLLLYEYARQYEQTSFRGLNSFISFIKEIHNSSQSISEAPAVSEDNDCVRIMSIHKSKGLEFEVCFLGNAGKEITKTNKELYILRRSAGVFFKKRYIRSLYVRESMVAKLYKKAEKHDDAAESMRSLYVALTRAKSKLIVTGSWMKKSTEKNGTYLECICNAFEYADKSGVVEFLTIPAAQSNEQALVENTTPEAVDTFDNARELEKRLAYVYPYAAISVSKIAVSELEMNGENGFTISDTYAPQLAEPKFLHQGIPSATEAGTAMHMFIQFADFDFAERSGSEAEAKRLVECEFLTEQQLDLLDFERLDAFFSGELYNRIKKSPSVIREKRFSIMEDSGFFGLPSGGSVMVQGVIDLFFEENGAYTVVDFKTDRITEAKISDFIDRHIAQLAYYCRAIERMSGKRVNNALLYSFAIGRAIETSAAQEMGLSIL